jgi:phage tail sheath gpL-like
VIVLGGPRLDAAPQALAWFASNKSTELWIGVLADNGAASPRTGTIVVTAATAAGTIALYLGGERVTVGVNAGDADRDRDCDRRRHQREPRPAGHGERATARRDLTFRHKGAAGNSYDVRDSFRDGEALPAGVSLAITRRRRRRA